MTGTLEAGGMRARHGEAGERAGRRPGWRTASVLLAAGVLLAGCAGLPGYGEAPVRADNSNLDPPMVDLPENLAVGEPPLPPRRPDVSGDLALAPPISAPLDDAANEPVDVDSLVGLDTGETAALLGEPALQEVQPPARVWSYNGPDCTLTIFFYPQVEGERFRALAYDVADAVPSEQSAQRCFSALVAQNRTASDGRPAPAGTGIGPGISQAPPQNDAVGDDSAAGDPGAGDRNVAESAPAN